jgi:hypothetical protein
VETRIAEEEERLACYLHPSTGVKLFGILNKELLEESEDELLNNTNSGFVSVLRQFSNEYNNDPLNRTYLCRCVEHYCSGITRIQFYLTFAFYVMCCVELERMFTLFGRVESGHKPMCVLYRQELDAEVFLFSCLFL